MFSVLRLVVVISSWPVLGVRDIAIIREILKDPDGSVTGAAPLSAEEIKAGKAPQLASESQTAATRPEAVPVVADLNSAKTEASSRPLLTNGHTGNSKTDVEPGGGSVTSVSITSSKSKEEGRVSGVDHVDEEGTHDENEVKQDEVSKKRGSPGGYEGTTKTKKGQPTNGEADRGKPEDSDEDASPENSQTDPKNEDVNDEHRRDDIEQEDRERKGKYDEEKLKKVKPDAEDEVLEQDWDLRSEEFWRIVRQASRHRHRFQPPESESERIESELLDVFRSNTFYDTVLLLIFLAVMVPAHVYMLQVDTNISMQIFMLIVWIGFGCLYCACIANHFGGQAAMRWGAGYWLEFIFSVDNIFVFQAVVSACDVPKEHTRRMLLIVCCFQVVIALVFFMGLATWLRTIRALPYIVGVWLIFLGVVCAMHDPGAAHSHPPTSGVLDRLVNLLRCCLGDRLWPVFDEDGSIIVEKNGRYVATLLAPVLCLLLLADALNEVDTAITKIEEIPDGYIAFSSSALATFTLPELFFVVTELFSTFFALRFGMSLVLCFFGAQMLLGDYYALPVLVSCGVVFGVMLAGMGINCFMERCSGRQQADGGEAHDSNDGAETNAQSEVPAIQSAVPTTPSGESCPS